MQICGPAKMRCTYQAENDLFLTEARDVCNCLPSCATVTYEVEPNQVNYDLLRAMSLSKHQTQYDSEK